MLWFFPCDLGYWQWFVGTGQSLYLVVGVRILGKDRLRSVLHVPSVLRGRIGARMGCAYPVRSRSERNAQMRPLWLSAVHKKPPSVGYLYSPLLYPTSLVYYKLAYYKFVHIIHKGCASPTRILHKIRTHKRRRHNNILYLWVHSFRRIVNY